VAAGLEQLLSFLEDLHFTPEEINWLKTTESYRPTFLNYLKDFHFTGDVEAMKEGTLFFPNEPIIRVSAPLPEAQLVESRLINLIHFQTVIASKAARSSLVARNKTLVDFGLRRAHGAEAGLLGSRASYLGGYSGTSTLQAGQIFQIPTFGTMAHSFIQAHESETLAFEHFAESQMTNITFLIDTYDTEKAAVKVVELTPKLIKKGYRIIAVRLDSGNLCDHSKKVRRILDEGGLESIKIFVSGNLDEEMIHQLLEDGSPIDGFGVGTRLATSADSPYLDCAYKLQEYANRPKRKRSEGKATWPGRKQVYRRWNEDQTFLSDTITLVHHEVDGEPLLNPVMKNGHKLRPTTPLKEIRSHVLKQLQLLPPPLKKLEKAEIEYPVKIAQCLLDLAKELDQ
jgi:nicotinate phosphoribosyltransferase